MDTKDQALEIAKTQLQTKGFNGFSFQDIADTLGIKKASLHYYFSSKEDLALEIMHSYEAGFAEWSKKTATLPPEKRLEKWFNLFFRLANEGHKICPVGALCTDLDIFSKATRSKILQFHELQRDWIQQNLKQGQALKAYKADLKPEPTSDLIMASIQGALQIARLKKNPQVVKQVAKQLMANLNRP